MNLHRPRGKGVRRKMSGYTKFSDNWMDFLRDPINKKEHCCYSQGWTVQLATSQRCVCHIRASCGFHEKADTRCVVHVLHALEQGKQTIYVHTVYTDVVVIIAGMI